MFGKRCEAALVDLALGKLICEKVAIRSGLFDIHPSTRHFAVIDSGDDGYVQLWSFGDGCRAVGERVHLQDLISGSFSEDGSYFAAVVEDAVHFFRVQPDGLSLVASRALSGKSNSGASRFIDDHGPTVEALVSLDYSEMRLDQIHLEPPPPIAGDPAALLARYENMLGMKIADNGRITVLPPQATSPKIVEEPGQ